MEAAPERKVFTRQASGLVRNARILDLAWFALWTASPLVTNFFLVPLYAALLPGADVRIASLVGILLAVPVVVMYAALGSMMPRAGGDYLYESRGLHPAVAMSVVMGWFIFLAIPTFLAGTLQSLATLGLAPIITLAGVLLNNSSLTASGGWFATSTGVFVVSVVALTIGLLHAMAGMTWVARITRYVLIPIIVLSGIVILVILGTTSAPAYVQSVNFYGSKLANDPNLYQNVIQGAATAGFPTPAFSVVNTTIVAFILGAFFYYAVAAAPILGEVKGANSLKNVFKAYVLAMVLVGFFFTFLEFILFYNVVGWDFTHASSIVGLFGLKTATGNPLPFYPSFGFLTAMATTSLPLIVLASLGFIIIGYAQPMFNIFFVSRVLVSMSIDGLLPGWFSNINARTRSPFNSLLFMFVVIVGTVAVFTFVPGGFFFVLGAALLTSQALIFVTSLSGLFFQWRRPEIHRASPVSKYRGLLPLASGLSLLVSGGVIYYYFTVPALGVAGSPGLTLLAVSFLIFLALYFVMRAYQKRKGIIVDLAAREIPPE